MPHFYKRIAQRAGRTDVKCAGRGPMWSVQAGRHGREKLILIGANGAGVNRQVWAK